MASHDPSPTNETPVDVSAPNIGRFRRGNAGPSFYLTRDSGRAGPHVLINALVHGNELCGVHAVAALIDAGVRPKQGRLTLGFANVAAYRRFDPANPSASRYVDEDLNRVWDPAALDGPGRSSELSRARELRLLIDDVDLLLDIHSMQHASPPLLLAGSLQKGRRLAEQVGYPAIIVCDDGHKAGRRLRDYGGFGRSHSAKNALLVECGQHWAQSSVAVAMETCARFLTRLDIVEPAAMAPFLPPLGSEPQVIQVTHAVTVATPDFRFVHPFQGLEVISRAGDPIAVDGDRPIVAPYDDCILVMPSRRLIPGLTAVRLGHRVA